MERTLAEHEIPRPALPLAWAAEAVGAQVCGDSSGSAFGICTDTRRGAKGSLFFALSGENGDGHRYVAQAFAAGATAAVVSERIVEVSGTQLLVPDTLRALGDLAVAYRRQFDIPLIGITGSVGKTSTKEMIAAILRSQYDVLASEKNYNNEIGVPLTLFGLCPEHRAAVIEMGMRGVGEIDRLAEIAEPTIGVITGIGHAHIERLGSREAIAQAKSELFARLPRGGTAILAEGDFEAYLRSRVPEGCRIVSCGMGDGSKADVVALNPQAFGSEPMRVRIAGEEFMVPLAVVGEHHNANALLALATAHVLQVPPSEAVAALSAWEGVEGRMTIRHTEFGATILDDCYNAGPESIGAALKTLKQLTGGGGIAVLGDMREMGEFAPALHYALGQPVMDAHLRMLVTVGASTPEIERGARDEATKRGADLPDLRHFATTEEAANEIRELVRAGDTVLVKGSRAMEMEHIVAALMGERVQAVHD